jgi:hypothetical protein
MYRNITDNRVRDFNYLREKLLKYGIVSKG